MHDKKLPDCCGYKNVAGKSLRIATKPARPFITLFVRRQYAGTGQKAHGLSLAGPESVNSSYRKDARILGNRKSKPVVVVPIVRVVPVPVSRPWPLPNAMNTTPFSSNRPKVFQLQSTCVSNARTAVGRIISNPLPI